MRADGFPDLIRLTTFQRSIADAKTQLTAASKELVTGERADLARVLGGKAGEYNLVTKALADIDAAKARTTLAESRLSQTSVVVNTIRASFTEFAGEAQAALQNNGAFGLAEVQESARGQIASTLSLLNSTHAGRSLFAGDAVHSAAVLDAEALLSGLETAIGGSTDEAAIDAAISAFFAPGGGFDTTMYSGGAGEAAAVEIAGGNTLQYDVKADNAAFKDVLEGLSRVVFASNSTSTEWASATAGKMNEGINGIISLQADIGRQQRLAQTAIDINEAEKMILNESRVALAGVDQFEAAGRVQALEAQLQAAYTVASRLSRLTFTAYL